MWPNWVKCDKGMHDNNVKFQRSGGTRLFSAVSLFWWGKRGQSYESFLNSPIRFMKFLGQIFLDANPLHPQTLRQKWKTSKLLLFCKLSWNKENFSKSNRNFGPLGVRFRDIPLYSKIEILQVIGTMALLGTFKFLDKLYKHILDWISVIM